MIEKPIFLLGTHRSGTTYLADVLSRHPSLTYWPEPKYIWTISNRDREDDTLDESHATAAIKRKITKKVQKYLSKKNAYRLLEKTPSNCLKIKFIHSIFPDAHFIHIIRDGRSVIKSTEEVINRGLTLGVIARRAKQIPFQQWPQQIEKLLHRVMRSSKSKEKSFWGPKPKDWKSWIEHDTHNEILAKQWSSTISCALKDSTSLPANQYHRITYDQLVLRPEETVSKLLQLVELDPDEPLLEYAKATANPGRLNTWKSDLSEQVLTEIRPIMEPVLIDLGYKW